MLSFSYGIVISKKMNNSKILVIEDDNTLLEVLHYTLEKEGYTVAMAQDGEQALEIARQAKPDLIVLDIMLPKLNGLDVCRILRKEMTVPIIMLTAKSDEVDKIVGLEIGADDYITKPFSMRELLARIRAMLRRLEMMIEVTSSMDEVLLSSKRFGNLEIDVERRKVSVSGTHLDLSPKEFDLLTYLAANKGRVFSRDSLLEKVWGYDYAGDTRTVDVHIRWLRQKIEADPAHPQYILTVRGVGYKFEV